MRYSRLRNGFTLVEILVSTVVLLLAITAFFAVFMNTGKFRVGSENKLEIYVSVMSWLEKVRTGQSSSARYENIAAQTDVDLNDGSSILPEDYSNWLVANKGSVDMQNPGDNSKGVLYSVDDSVDLGSGVNFKKITVEATWDQLE